MESTESIPDTRNAARDYTNRGWSVVPVPHGEKGPKLDGWQNLRIKAGEVDEYFVGTSNIGIQLGEASGGLADVDLDCPEAVSIGPAFLSPTLQSGRGDKITHHGFVAPGSRSVKFKDTNGDVLVEIRGEGGYQTLVSPSKHPSGDLYEWKNDRDPREIEAHELRSAVARVAVSSLIAKHLPDGGRHDLTLAYAGLFLKNLMELGEDKEDAVVYVCAILDPAWAFHNAEEKSL
jgi:hypothetical protein